MSLPPAFNYSMARLQGATKNLVKIMPQTSTTASANSIITVRLPSNTVINLQNISLYFTPKITSAGGGAYVPVLSSSYVQRVQVYAGGVPLYPSSMDQYNVLYKLLYNAQAGSVFRESQSLMHQDLRNYGTAAAGTSDLPVTVISDWLWAKCSPHYWDTSLIDVVLEITLAPNDILAKESAGTTSASYVLDNLYMTVETWSFNSPIYANLIQKVLSENGQLEIPYFNFYSYTSSNNASIRISCNSKNINALVSTARDNTYNTLALTTNGDSNFFKFSKSGITSIQLVVNNLLIPSQPVPCTDSDSSVYNYVLDQLNDVNNLQAGNSLLFVNGVASPTRTEKRDSYYNNNFVFMHKFTIDDQQRILSGLDASNNTNIYLNTTGSPTGQALIFLLLTSVLKVNASRMVEVEL